MKIKTRQDLIKTYTAYFKKQKHKEIPSFSLIPENDPTVLFTTAGMHPLVPFLTGQQHPLGKRIVNVQKCIRTNDIEEVGDSVHHTFFEMLGNWSFGDYWKSDAIKFTYSFLTQSLKISPKKLAISCYKGGKNIPKDLESAKIWEQLGIPKEKIAYLGKEDNWWGPAGNIGPCGPDTEIFFWAHKTINPPKKFNPEDKNWVEIGNNVLMQYHKDEKSNYTELKQKNIDFGGGVERTLSVLLGHEDDYLSPTFLPIVKEIEKLSNKKYGSSIIVKKSIRIIADHIKTAIIILSDNHSITPSNLGQGYVLRRLIRRSIRHARLIGIKGNFTTKLFDSVYKIYPDYSELKKNKNFILAQLDEEENKFAHTLTKGLLEFNKLIKDKKSLTGKEAFLLFQSYGFPIEMTKELSAENKIKINLKDFYTELKKHQELSRTSTKGKFSSGLSDNSKQTKKLHTATHLLNEALRKVLGPEVKQRGSNITSERLRFDFNFSRKLSSDEIAKVESLVNKKINAHLNVEKKDYPLSKALKSGAQAEFGSKYPSKVTVYTITDNSDKRGWFSKEICTGPHVSNTKEIGTFKIVKESSSAAGVRRIKAIIK